MTAFKTAISAAQTAKDNRQQEWDAAYTDLVQRLATGANVAGDEVLGILEAAGKTEEDLLAAFASIEEMKQFPIITRERNKLRKQNREVTDEIAELTQQLETVQLTLRDRHDDLRRITGRLNHLTTRRSELLSKHPECVPEFGEAKELFRLYAGKVTIIGGQLSERKRAVQSHQQRLNKLRDDQKQHLGPFNADQQRELTAAIQDAKQALGKLQTEVDDLEQEFATATQKRDDAKRQLNQI